MSAEERRGRARDSGRRGRGGCRVADGTRLHDHTTGPMHDAADLFERLTSTTPIIHHAHELAAEMDARPGTFMSRFARAGAPSPKDLIAEALLCHVAHATRWRDFRLTTAAMRLGFSSPQHLSRFIRVTGCTTLDQLRINPPAQLARFRRYVLNECGDTITTALRTGTTTHASR